MPNSVVEALQCDQHGHPDGERDDDGHQPARLHQRRACTFSRSGGSNVRDASAAVGAPAQPHRRAAQPRRSRLRLVRGRRQHRDQAVVGHPPARLGDAGVAEERALADRRLGDVNPAAAEFVGRHHGVVGQERAVLDDGELRR